MNQNKVYIVGAGTGRVENLTVKARDLIEKADIIFYDRLVNDNLLMLTKATCKKVYVGKKPEGQATAQEEIISHLIEASREYPVIVRLKSGDPYVFGRGGEEAVELDKFGIAYEVVPGLTSSIAGPSYAGIPITYRDIALDFHVFTARSKDGDAEHDWEAISRLKGTLVFMMGVKNLQKISSALIAAGKSSTTPVAIIEWASRSQQKMVVGTLDTIYDKATEAGIKPPSIIVIGEVVQFNETLNYFMRKPLFGYKVGVPQSQVTYLLPMLEDLGAEVVLFTSPTKQEVRLEFTPQDLPTSLMFMDTTSVYTFIHWMKHESIDWRTLPEIKLTAVGHHTQKAFHRMGVHPDYFYENLLDFSREEVNTQAAYLASEETHAYYRNLKGKETLYSEIVTNREVFGPLENQSQLEEVDLIVYSNTKAVRSVEKYGEVKHALEIYQSIPAYCLGEQSSELLKSLGFKQIIQTPEATFRSLKEVLVTRCTPTV